MAAPRILIIGTGAVGGYFGARLDQAGAEVSFYARSDAAHLKKKGMQIHSPKGAHFFYPAQVISDSQEYEGTPDFLLVATKATDTANVIAQVRPLVGEETVLAIMQNGIFVEKPFVSSFPNSLLLGVIVRIGASRTAPGVIRHHHRGELVLGNYPAGNSDKAFELSQLFAQGGVKAELTDQIQWQRWHKLVWNASFNPLSVVLGGLNTHQLIQQERHRLIGCMKEVMQAAHALGYSLPANLAESNIDLTLTWPPYKTSMLLDYEAGRKLEIEPILGNLLAAAAQAELSLPMLESLYKQLLQTQR